MPAIISDSASFFTRLRHSSFISAALAGHGSFSRSKSKVSSTSKSGFLLSNVDGVRHALAVALLEAREDHEGRLDVAGLDRIVELVAIALEVGDVARKEVASAAVDGVEVAVENQTRQMIVERRAAVVLAGTMSATRRAT